MRGLRFDPAIHTSRITHCRQPDIHVRHGAPEHGGSPAGLVAPRASTALARMRESDSSNRSSACVHFGSIAAISSDAFAAAARWVGVAGARTMGTPGYFTEIASSNSRCSRPLRCSPDRNDFTPRSGSNRTSLLSSRDRCRIRWAKSIDGCLSRKSGSLSSSATPTLAPEPRLKVEIQACPAAQHGAEARTKPLGSSLNNLAKLALLSGFSGYISSASLALSIICLPSLSARFALFRNRWYP